MPWEALCPPNWVGHGPVTTDPIKGEASFAVTPRSYDRWCGESRSGARRGPSAQDGRCAVVPLRVR